VYGGRIKASRKKDKTGRRQRQFLVVGLRRKVISENHTVVSLWVRGKTKNEKNRKDAIHATSCWSGVFNRLKSYSREHPFQNVRNNGRPCIREGHGDGKGGGTQM
jgi:hypothetical protein